MQIINKNQNPFRRKWTPSSPGVGYAKGQLEDEEYGQTLAVHDPLWRYILLHYKKEIYTHINVAPVVVLGYSSLAVAIELSQWGYDIVFITDKFEEQEKAKKDCKIQAGSLKENIWFNYRKNIPRAACMCFIENQSLPGSSDGFVSFVNMALRRVREVVCAVKDDRDWSELLRDKFEMKTYKYPNSSYRFLALKALE